jgi:hypothetical protein
MGKVDVYATPARRSGCPRVDQTISINYRMTPTIHAELKRSADEACRSIQNEITFRLLVATWDAASPDDRTRLLARMPAGAGEVDRMREENHDLRRKIGALESEIADLKDAPKAKEQAPVSEITTVVPEVASPPVAAS